MVAPPASTAVEGPSPGWLLLAAAVPAAFFGAAAFLSILKEGASDLGLSSFVRTLFFWTMACEGHAVSILDRLEDQRGED